MIVRHTFPPHNNTRLSHLCGPMDAHLRSIEAGLQVSIAHRHEQFKVDGPKAQAQRAMELLQALYEMAERPIAADTLQLMMAGDTETGEQPPLQTRRADLKARTPVQAAYLDSIASHDITFGIGPAGTGKTYLAVAYAAAMLERGGIDRIVLSRPAVEAGERLADAPHVSDEAAAVAGDGAVPDRMLAARLDEIVVRRAPPRMLEVSLEPR